jgi:O-antigen ligase
VSTERIRYERIIWALRIAKRVSLVVALVATFAPGSTGRSASAAAVGLVIAAPLVRVGWLVYRWWRWRDRAFAAVAAALLLVVGTGTALAFVTR